MKRPLFSVAIRLTVWFLFLSVMLLIVMTVFVRKNAASDYAHQLARSNAVFVSRLGGDSALEELVLSSQPPNAAHFLIDRNGIYIAHPNMELLGASMRNDYSAETMSKILQGGSGYALDAQAGMVVGYAEIPGKNWIDIVSMQLHPIDTAIGRLTRFSSLPLAVILLIIYMAGAVVIWILVGDPLLQLTLAAEHIGGDDLDYKLDPGKMHGELKVLANTLNASGDRIKALVSGLEERVLELKLANFSLQENEERFRAMFDSANDAILVHDLETGALLHVNAKFTELYGYGREEAPALTIEDISSGIPPYTHRSAVHWIRRARRSGPQALEWQAKDKSGRLFWVDLSMRVAVIGGQERLLVSARDITARKRSDQIQVAGYRIFQIGQSSQTLFEFFHLIHEILENLIPARNFMVAFYDPLTDLFTYPYHFDQYETWPSIHHSDNGLVAHVLSSDEPLLATSETIADLGMVLKPDLEHPFLDWLGVPLRTTRGVLGVLVIKNYDEATRLSAQDQETFAFISTQIAIAVERRRAEDALRESEARWRTLIENSPQLIMIIDRQGKILLINHMMGKIEHEKLQEQMIFKFLPGNDLAGKQDAL